MEKQAEVMDNWLRIRLDTVLPEIMRREKIDMWVVICREYNEDPVFLTLVPSRWYAARRTTMLVFFDQGKEGVER
ncbi:MAG: Xaa-Pro aminopeptidase, partial [Candidatus Aminicenantes bacterium]|nr:Xaa-Pro aminopeptidase [Candidatus Aminicenantes bacterium]NIN18222.1 Xaa-Pro aminopeptidase [Candidatus Aminicenantes bacterium]NIN42119.1 Xaa-Pro aminopeptidase [Candidatus Aminicenantes bacterium]NIN84875.1 Xaa-Pro aminopeptidase [Candidatus Aminicenantes bacterium]NIO81047.1 Xaa-Pro aminopeptidase [Candidatus Aminicenantes bacterium]